MLITLVSLPWLAAAEPRLCELQLSVAQHTAVQRTVLPGRKGDTALIFAFQIKTRKKLINIQKKGKIIMILYAELEVSYPKSASMLPIPIRN